MTAEGMPAGASDGFTVLLLSGRQVYVGRMVDGFEWDDAASSDDDDDLGEHPWPGPAWRWPLEWLNRALADPGHVRRHPVVWLGALVRWQPPAREYEVCEPDSLPWIRTVDDEDDYCPVRFSDRLRGWLEGLRPVVVARLTIGSFSWPLKHPGKWLRALFLPWQKDGHQLVSGWGSPPSLDDFEDSPE